MDLMTVASVNRQAVNYVKNTEFQIYCFIQRTSIQSDKETRSVMRRKEGKAK
jgi:hypothetical protein